AIAGYPDLYVLGALGAGRRQIQVLNRKDNCCFGESVNEYDATAHGPWDVAMRTVEHEVQSRLLEIGEDAGRFRLAIDEAPSVHTVSWNSLVSTILAELDGGLHDVAASSSTRAFVRRHGTIWEWNAGIWKDTALDVAGTPAVIATDSRTDLFYRSPSNV